MTEARPGAGDSSGLSIGPLLPADHSDWCDLFREYAASTNSPVTTEVIGRVWDWLFDRDYELEAVVVRNHTCLLGFAHFRVHPIPLCGDSTLYIHDFFVDASVRKRGIGKSVLGALKDEAARRGCASVQWHTTEDNIDAQRFYDRYGTRSVWVAYEMAV